MLLGQEHKDESTFNPCGLHGLQRDGLTYYFYYNYGATYKELSEEDVENFKTNMELEDSKVSNIRIFKSKYKEGYAVMSSYLFQNFLGGDVLVELYCIERINGSPVLYLTDKGIEKFLGKTYEELE